MGKAPKHAALPADGAPGAADLRRVELLAFGLRGRLDAASQLVAEYSADLEEIRARYAPRIRRLAGEVKSSRAVLADAVKAAFRVFLDPSRKTQSEVFHGIACGFAKTRDTWTVVDGDLVALIRERLPDQVEVLIDTKPRVRLDALTDAHREALGMRRIPGTYEPFAREKAGSVEKTIAALSASLPHAEKEPA